MASKAVRQSNGSVNQQARRLYTPGGQQVNRGSLHRQPPLRSQATSLTSIVNT